MFSSVISDLYVSVAGSYRPLRWSCTHTGMQAAATNPILSQLNVFLRRVSCFACVSVAGLVN